MSRRGLLMGMMREKRPWRKWMDGGWRGGVLGGSRYAYGEEVWVRSVGCWSFDDLFGQPLDL